MEIFTKESMSITSEKEWGTCSIFQQGKSMRVTGRRITRMVLGHFLMPMEISMRVSGCRIRDRVRENFILLMEQFIKELSLMITFMDME